MITQRKEHLAFEKRTKLMAIRKGRKGTTCKFRLTQKKTIRFCKLQGTSIKNMRRKMKKKMKKIMKLMMKMIRRRKTKFSRLM